MGRGHCLRIFYGHAVRSSHGFLSIHLNFLTTNPESKICQSQNNNKLISDQTNFGSCPNKMNVYDPIWPLKVLTNV